MVRDFIIPIAITVAFLMTWSEFPNVGDRITSLALSPVFSYIWPVALIWLVVFATQKTKRDLQDKVDVLPYFTYWTLTVFLVATWGFGVWHEIMTSESRFVREFLPLFVVTIGGLPVIGFYWGALLATALIFVACITRFIPGVNPWFVNTIDREPNNNFGSISSTYVSTPDNTQPGNMESESGNGNYIQRYNDDGYIYEGTTTLGVPLGLYEDGYIYQGDTTLGLPLGRYEDGYIYQGDTTLGLPLGRYEDGYIYQGDTTLGLPLGRYEDGCIYQGDTTLGVPLGRYDGDEEGGGAAAAVILGLLD